MNKKVLKLTRGALIAALYVILTLISALFGLDKGAIQLRLAEALTILPVVFPEAVLGLYIGCILANTFSGALVADVFLGSLATLIGAYGAYLLRRLPKKLIWVATLPTVISNAIIVPLVLIFAYEVDMLYSFMLLTVSVGELLSATLLGTVLYFALDKNGFFKKYAS
ncbi:MAG: QueT transporter family protein [Clostridia bacterium]|nr:QueT transporter family protein [Clostridia bacterium]